MEEDLFVRVENECNDSDNESNTLEGHDVDDKVHARLINDIAKLSGRKRGNAIRTVRGSSNDNSLIDNSDLLKRINDQSLRKSIGELETLPKPLEKPVANRIKRAAGFEKLSIEVNKWENLVHIRRKADQLKFPAQELDVRVETVDKIGPTEPKTELQKKVYNLLHGAKLIKDVAETEAERTIRRAMSIEEVKERNREMWRLREMRQRMEHKAAMQNKSKSRKFHKVLRKEKLKKQKAEIEALVNSDPEAALDKLKELDDVRIQERMSLRHRKSKWAHLQGLRATHDKKSLAAVQENKRLHNELKQRQANNSFKEDDDDQEQEEDMSPSEDPESGIETPWSTKKKKKSSGTDDIHQNSDEISFTKLRKFWDEVNLCKINAKKTNSTSTEVSSEMHGMSTDEKEHSKSVKNEKIKNTVKVQNIRKAVKNEKKKETIQNDGIVSVTQMDPNVNEKKDTVMTNVSGSVIDEMFDQAEDEIKLNVKRSLEKISCDDETSFIKKKKSLSMNKSALKDLNNGFRAVAKLEHDFACRDTKEKLDETLQGQQSSDPPEGGILQGIVAEPESNQTKDSKIKQKKALIDPTAFMKVKSKKLSSSNANSTTLGEDVLDDDESMDEEEDAEDYIQDALADDYLIDEFKNAKEDTINKSKPLQMTLAMPGWGDWGGPGVEVSKRKARNFRIKTPRPLPRKDSTIGNVIYNESADVHNNLRKTMVSEIPFPFTSVKDFEASVRAPIGRSFVPEHVHRKLITPPVVTKLGATILPMDEDALLKKTTIKKRHNKNRNSEAMYGGEKSNNYHRNNKHKTKSRGGNPKTNLKIKR